MAEELSHEIVSKRMHNFLLGNLIRDDRPKKRGDEIRAKTDGQDVVMIAPVRKKQQPSLESKLKDNTANGIATTFVLPRSTSGYKGNYLKPVKCEKFPEGGIERWHNLVNLTSIEMYLIETFGNAVYYFDPSDMLIESMRFKRLPERVIAYRLLGLEPPGAREGDYELLERGEILREEFGPGFTNQFGPADRARYKQLRRIQKAREAVREKLSNGIITKSTFRLEVCEKGGLLTARIVPYEVQTSLHLMNNYSLARNQ